jgi:hypothetical protein
VTGNGFSIRVFAAACGTAGILLLSGCAGSLFNRPSAPPMAPAALLDLLRRHAERLETFQGRGQFTVVSDQGSFRGGIRIAAHPPDSIWIKLEGPLGIDLVTASIASGRVIAYSPWMKADTSDSSGARRSFAGLFPAGLDSLTVMSALFGLPVPAADGPDSLRSLTPEKDRYILRVGPDQSLWVETNGPVVRRWEKRHPSGDVAWAYEADQFHTSRGVRLPRRIRFSQDSAGQGASGEMVLYYELSQTNQPLKKGWCDVRLPKNAEGRAL